jgi:hypothetical protein
MVHNTANYVGMTLDAKLSGKSILRKNMMSSTSNSGKRIANNMPSLELWYPALGPIIETIPRNQNKVLECIVNAP